MTNDQCNNQDSERQLSHTLTRMQLQQKSSGVDDGISLPSLSDNIDLFSDEGGNIHRTDTFSTDPTLGERVYTSLERDVPQNCTSLSGRKYNSSLDVTLNNHPTLSHRTTQARSDIVVKELKKNDFAQKIGSHSFAQEVTRLYKTIELLSLSNNKLVEEKEDLQSKLSEQIKRNLVAEKTLCESEKEFSNAKKDLNESRSELQECISKMSRQKEDLENVNSKHCDIAAKYKELEDRYYICKLELQKGLDSDQELNNEIRSLLAENRKLRKEKEVNLSTLNLKVEENQSLEDENKRIIAQGDNSTYKTVALQTNMVETASIGIQTESLQCSSRFVGHGSKTDHLSRVREISERTALLREHQKDIDLVKEEYEDQIREIEVRHLEQLRELEKQTVEQHGTMLQQCKRSQVIKYQKRLIEVEEQHQMDMSKIRDEFNQQLAATAESVGVAMNEVKAATEQYEDESQKRLSLEEKLERLTKDYEQQTLNVTKQHAREIASLTSTWKKERTLLLDEIQVGCAELIDSRRGDVKPVSVSPFSASVQANHKNFQFTMSHNTEDLSSQILSPTSQTTATSTTVSQSLAETEAFVQKVLDGNYF
mmetsp:Transcript_22657/g.33452  ORF Transcript_22657/g.33452 Transcript_22657/m.33452 type:complete len:595 (+) Transcript_22657:82-1866(+)|eukprot:CAMPEP_0194231696 /NCGR_PEP_ID=MMETSP0158-20130606/338_1 /TAXON_ID=33649 /ORGANISM="Thalassionema nitzschioides, Strain L26-B" /LENGTH=594 /DNA_ID=CAMNT_0038964351 /DNA_START=56 /DNA_END=1840 /DNA_ORIENTATION=-